MARLELIGVPFDGYGRPGNQARAAGVLRENGLVDAFAGHDVDVTELRLPGPTAVRGTDTSLVNEPALLAMTAALAEQVRDSVAAGRFPVIYGGDCTTLLGTMVALRDHPGGVGLMFVDGHEDTMPLDVSEDGEAANAEIGLLLGITGRLLRGPLNELLPALRPERLVMLAQRDEDWRRQFNVGSLAGLGVWSRPLAAVAPDPSRAGREAVRHLELSAERWWLHIDLDVLDPQELFAQGLPGIADEPGGLTWIQLTEVALAALGAGGCVGLSVAIYDPDQDPHRNDAAAIVAFLKELARHLR
jgi:arginase